MPQRSDCSRRSLALGTPVLLTLLALARPAAAADTLDTGDTAWILVSTALVLFMTIPGLALFSLTVSAQYYTRWVLPADKAPRETLLWIGYAPVYALLVGQLIYLMIARLRRRVTTRRSASSRRP